MTANGSAMPETRPATPPVERQELPNGFVLEHHGLTKFPDGRITATKRVETRPDGSRFECLRFVQLPSGEMRIGQETQIHPTGSTLEHKNFIQFPDDSKTADMKTEKYLDGSVVEYYDWMQASDGKVTARKHVETHSNGTTITFTDYTHAARDDNGGTKVIAGSRSEQRFDGMVFESQNIAHEWNGNTFAEFERQTYQNGNVKEHFNLRHDAATQTKTAARVVEKWPAQNVTLEIEGWTQKGDGTLTSAMLRQKVGTELVIEHVDFVQYPDESKQATTKTVLKNGVQVEFYRNWSASASGEETSA